MDIKFLNGITPGSVEAEEIQKLLRSSSKKVNFPWEPELVDEAITCNGGGQKQLYPEEHTEPKCRDTIPHDQPITKMTKLNVNAQPFIPGSSWTKSEATQNDLPNPNLLAENSCGPVDQGINVAHSQPRFISEESLPVVLDVKPNFSDYPRPYAPQISAQVTNISFAQREPDVAKLTTIQFGDVDLSEILEAKSEVKDVTVSQQHLVNSTVENSLDVVENKPEVISTNGPSVVDIEKHPEPLSNEAPVTTTPVQVSASAGNKVGKWADLFANSTTQSPKPVVPVEKSPSVTAVIAPKPSNELGGILSQLKLCQNAVITHPRRLINKANWCYINSILQPLLACPPFYHMLKSLPSDPVLSSQKSVTPVLDAMIEFVNMYSEVDKAAEKSKKAKGELSPGKPLEPVVIYNVIPKMKASENSFQRGRQEDAEEFLSCLLNTLDEEIREAIKANHHKTANGTAVPSHMNGTSDDTVDSDDGSDWKQVLPKNKAVITHSSTNAIATPISLIFGGCVRSSVHTTNSESARVEPFFTVPLDVQNVNSVEDALHAFVCKEELDGYTCPQTKKRLDAHRRMTFDELPNILILHLKCFVYDKQGGSLKVMHTITFKENLEFDKDLLSPLAQKHLQKNQRSYKLFAVVYHSGEKTTGGHYHADVFHTGERSWIRFDDDKVEKIGIGEVLDKKQKCVPYLLYYKRLDTMQTQSATGPHATSK